MTNEKKCFQFNLKNLKTKSLMYNKQRTKETDTNRDKLKKTLNGKTKIDRHKDKQRD